MNSDSLEMTAADADALKSACDAARADVASKPDDEARAEALVTAVEQARGVRPATTFTGLPPVAPPVGEAVVLLQQGQEERAEIVLRQYLRTAPNDPNAMRLMADIAKRCGLPEDAERILRRLVEVSPGLSGGWVALAQHLSELPGASVQSQRIDEILSCLQTALEIQPEDAAALNLKTTLLVQSGRLDVAEKAAEQHVRAMPNSPMAWVNYGYLLKTFGRFGEAVAAYRTAAALDPANGAIWWSLADLKRARFFPADIRRMEEALDQTQAPAPRINLHFALATAYDQAKDFEKAAQHLRDGNAGRLTLLPYNIEGVKQEIDAAIATYTPEFFIQREGAGDPRPDPIFILGMPRSGSTLVEQILSSHSRVEGTKELFAVSHVLTPLLQTHQGGPIETSIASMPISGFRQMGSRYLEMTRPERQTDRPHFTDKNPDNWRHVGLIHTMLPKAKIIDIRRDPMDCCFANYSQHFLAGADYTYGFEEMASRYTDYVRLMRHMDEVLPGTIHRVIYEDLVDDLEGEVRRLLDYLELPFEDSCLRFFETERAVHTPSAEQVRQPINRSGLGKWKPYEPWLGGLKKALGNLADDWRG